MNNFCGCCLLTNSVPKNRFVALYKHELIKAISHETPLEIWNLLLMLPKLTALWQNYPQKPFKNLGPHCRNLQARINYENF